MKNFRKISAESQTSVLQAVWRQWFEQCAAAAEFYQIQDGQEQIHSFRDSLSVYPADTSGSLHSCEVMIIELLPIHAHHSMLSWRSLKNGWIGWSLSFWARSRSLSAISATDGSSTDDLHLSLSSTSASSLWNLAPSCPSTASYLIPAGLPPTWTSSGPKNSLCGRSRMACSASCYRV